MVSAGIDPRLEPVELVPPRLLSIMETANTREKMLEMPHLLEISTQSLRRAFETTHRRAFETTHEVRNTCIKLDEIDYTHYIEVELQKKMRAKTEIPKIEDIFDPVVNIRTERYQIWFAIVGDKYHFCLTQTGKSVAPIHHEAHERLYCPEFLDEIFSRMHTFARTRYWKALDDSVLEAIRIGLVKQGFNAYRNKINKSKISINGPGGQKEIFIDESGFLKTSLGFRNDIVFGNVSDPTCDPMAALTKYLEFYSVKHVYEFCGMKDNL